MEYCKVNSSGIITDIIVADSLDDAKIFLGEDSDIRESYKYAEVGKKYKTEPTQLDKLEAQTTYTAMMTNTLLKED